MTRETPFYEVTYLPYNYWLAPQGVEAREALKLNIKLAGGSGLPKSDAMVTPRDFPLSINKLVP